MVSAVSLVLRVVVGGGVGTMIQIVIWAGFLGEVRRSEVAAPHLGSMLGCGLFFHCTVAAPITKVNFRSQVYLPLAFAATLPNIRTPGPQGELFRF